MDVERHIEQIVRLAGCDSEGWQRGEVCDLRVVAVLIGIRGVEEIPWDDDTSPSQSSVHPSPMAVINLPRIALTTTRRAKLARLFR